MLVNRRQALAGFAGSLVASSSLVPAAALAPMSLSASTTDRGNAVDVTVRVSMHAGGINFSNRSFGPIRVPKTGQQVKKTFRIAGIFIVITLVIVGIVLTIVTFGSLGATTAAAVVLASATLKVILSS